MFKLARSLVLPLAVILIIGIVPSSMAALERHSGDNRYETAAAISAAGWENGSDIVILARGDDFADALAGVPLAYMHSAPILLTRPGSLPQATSTELLRLEAKTVYILGGEEAVSKNVEDKLQEMGIKFIRIQGADRWETAVAIARVVAPDGTETAFVVYGYNFPDALAAASYAAAAGYPILLTNTDYLPAQTAQLIEELGIENIFVVGGTGVISGEVMDELPNPERIWGASRFLTALALAQRFAPEAASMYIATGTDASGGADAIAGAALAALNGTGVLLVGSTLPGAVQDFLGVNVVEAFILGGPGAVSQDVLQAIEAALAHPAPVRRNKVPVADEDSASTNEDVTVEIPVLSNDTDIDGDALTVSSVGAASHGTVEISADELFVTYTPNADYNGPDSFTYIASDGKGESAPTTVTVEITAVNDAPVAGDDVGLVREDELQSIQVLLNDSDIDGDSIGITEFSQGSNGTVAQDEDELIYTPGADFNGEDSFTYKISDSNGGTDTGTVRITVTPVNDLPVANADSASTDEDVAIDIPVLSNDTDIDGDTLTVSSVGAASHGTVEVSADELFVTYTPNADYNGTDSFTYIASDGKGESAPATVTIEITAVNDAPVAGDDVAIVREDELQSIQVLLNDSDIDGDSIGITEFSQGSNGTVAQDEDELIYTPGADFNGEDSFTYKISDSNGGTDTGTVRITITPVNDLPVANADSASTDEDVAVDIPVLSNDTDIDGDALTVSSVGAASHGTVEISADELFVTYTPNADYNGTDSFTYIASDGKGGEASATVTIEITAVNDTPVATDDNVTRRMSYYSTEFINVLANDSDIDGDSISISDFTQGSKGTVSRSGAGLNYKLGYAYSSYFGKDSFTYTISDGNGGTATATVNIWIQRVIYSTTIYTPIGTEVEYKNFTIPQAGTYKIVTSKYTNRTGSSLDLYDEDGKHISGATNWINNYAVIDPIALAPGNYRVKITNNGWYQYVECKLEVIGKEQN